MPLDVPDSVTRIPVIGPIIGGVAAILGSDTGPSMEQARAASRAAIIDRLYQTLPAQPLPQLPPADSVPATDLPSEPTTGYPWPSSLRVPGSIPTSTPGGSAVPTSSTFPTTGGPSQRNTSAVSIINMISQGLNVLTQVQGLRNRMPPPIPSALPGILSPIGPTPGLISLLPALPGGGGTTVGGFGGGPATARGGMPMQGPPSGYHWAKDGSGRIVRNRHMNPLNASAARRAIRRIKGARRMLRSIESSLPKRAAPRTLPRRK